METIERTSSGLGMAVVDLALILIFGAVIYLSYGLAGENGRINARLAELELEQSQFAGTKKEATKLSAAQTILARYSIAKGQEVGLVSGLEELGKKAGVSYVLNNAALADKVTLDLSVNGSYGNVYYFIKLLENYGFSVSFERLALSRGALAKQVSWTGNMQVSIPAQKQ
jgi:hypothetical protein